MSKPHPKGPRAFRNFFEPDRATVRSKVANVTASPADGASEPMIAIDSNDPRERIDLTPFAGRVAPPDGVLGAGFHLPANFQIRLSDAQPTNPPSTQFPSFADAKE